MDRNFRLTRARDSLIPMMTTRLMVSLRKAADASGSTESSGSTTDMESIRFARDTTGGTESGGSDIALRDMSSEGRIGLPRSYGQN